jgi:hypothetical protein
MTTHTNAKLRDAVLVSDRRTRPIMGLPVWEALPARDVPYSLSDPYILLHEGSLKPSTMAGMDTEHPHRGFDNLWYILKGSSSTGHSTGPGGAIERAELPEARCCFCAPEAAQRTRRRSAPTS